MTKKALVLVIIVVILLSSFEFVFASDSDTEEIANSETAQELYEIKEGVSESLDEYVEQYGSYAYGVAAYILNTLRIYSIPFCFVGIAIGAIYQYMLGIRKLDVRDKGFALIISFVTILLICQVLPLIFAIIVHGWRG